MKYLKMLGSVVLAGAALMALASSASATTFTSPAGTNYTGAVKAVSATEGLFVYINGVVQKTCKAELEWKTESHGAAVTAKGPVTSFALPECGAGVTLLKAGSFETHTWTEENSGSGAVTWNGVEITMPVFGGDCIYELEKPYVATLTGSKILGGKTPMINFETRWRVKSGWQCPPTEWKSYFQVTSPDYLDVD